MATFRCVSCGGLYVDPQPPGVRYFHTCADVVDHATDKRSPQPNARDENIVEEFTVFDGRVQPAHEKGRVGHVRLRSAGAGRVKLSDDDLLRIVTDQESCG